MDNRATATVIKMVKSYTLNLLEIILMRGNQQFIKCTNSFQSIMLLTYLKGKKGGKAKGERGDIIKYPQCGHKQHQVFVLSLAFQIPFSLMINRRGKSDLRWLLRGLF